MKNFVDYTSRKYFASVRVASPRLRNITHTRKISFSGLVIQITIVALKSFKIRPRYVRAIKDNFLHLYLKKTNFII
jgi:ASC-1-like (ASCH) protein